MPAGTKKSLRFHICCVGASEKFGSCLDSKPHSVNVYLVSHSNSTFNPITMVATNANLIRVSQNKVYNLDPGIGLSL